jgi:MFS family permease
MVVDRFDHRRLLLVTQLLSVSVSGGLAALEFTGAVTEPVLIAGAAGIGLIYAFTLPAQTLIIPSLVSGPDVRDAMAMNTVSNNVGRILAPVAGVAVIITIGFGWAFALNSFSFILMFAALTLIRCRRVARPRDEVAPSRILGAFRIAISDRRIALLLVMVALATVATDPIMVLGPSLSRDAFHTSDAWAAYFIAAFGAGSVLGSLIRIKQPSLRQAVLAILLLFGAVLVFVGAPMIGISLAAAAVAGLAALLTAAATQTLLFQSSKPQVSGRVIALWAFCYAGSRPPASLADGWLADNFGTRSAGFLIVVSSACVLIGVALWEVRCRLRKRRAPAISARSPLLRVPAVLREAYIILISG